MSGQIEIAELKETNYYQHLEIEMSRGKMTALKDENKQLKERIGETIRCLDDAQYAMECGNLDGDSLSFHTVAGWLGVIRGALEGNQDVP
jgi:hypothetical protein